MPNPTMGEVADIDIPSNTSGQVVAPIGVGGVQVVAGTATPIRTYANQGQGTWGILHPTGVVPVKPVRTGNVLGTSVIEEPSDVVAPIPNATPTVTTTILPMPIGGGMFGGGGGGGAGDSTDSGANAKKPNYLMYALIALGAYLAYKTFSKKEK
jgi:hypothetical protein